MVLRKEGDRSDILLNTVDIIILRLASQRKEVFTLWLHEYLKLNHKSLRTHLTRLIKFGFIIKTNVEGTNKYLIKPTPLGEEVLKIFGKFIGK